MLEKRATIGLAKRQREKSNPIKYVIMITIPV